MSEELLKRIEQIEQRLSRIEEQFAKPVVGGKAKKAYEGVVGGIRFLIDNGFFDTSKSLNEVIDELKREGYSTTASGVASTLSATFTLKQKTLTRAKKSDGWRYQKRT